VITPQAYYVRTRQIFSLNSYSVTANFHFYQYVHFMLGGKGKKGSVTLANDVVSEFDLPKMASYKHGMLVLSVMMLLFFGELFVV
jgi:hypothetical protein